MLGRLARSQDERVVVGMEHPDDAGVFRLPSGELLVQTVDLIAPIVNEPAAFGQIAAANSLSDVYAMGGRPITAMNIVCFPAASLPLSVLGEILDGALDRLREAGCALVGGHTVVDPELKFGLSVSGLIEGGAIWSIDRARVGDSLILTKPIGTGVINQALRKGKLDEGAAPYRQATRSMIALNAAGARAGRAAGVSSVTDITGFGLLGHAAQFARASRVTFEIDAAAVPVIEGVRALIADGMVPKRSLENAESYGSRVSGVGSRDDSALFFDPQTSGGLLASVPPERVSAFVDAMGDWQPALAVIGRVAPAGEHDVVVG